MIRLVTSTPGSGKTCLVMEWLLREIDRGFYKEFYSNIEGIRVAGVRPLPPNADWRELNPDKDPNEPPKLIIIDECQYFDAFMKENRSAHNRIGKDLSTHRHYGIDIWFITQSTKLLNDYVLENVGEHVHVHRPKKKKIVDVYWWSYCQKSLTKTAFKDADDKQKWRINEQMFDLYKSTSNVTDGKARTSQKVVSAVITGVIVMSVIAIMIAQALGNYTKMQGVPLDDVAKTEQAGQDKAHKDNTISPPTTSAPALAEQEQAEKVQSRRIYLIANNLPQDYEIRRVEPMLQVRGVVQKGKKCLAYNAYGDVMTLTQSECREYVNTGRVYRADTQPIMSSPSLIETSTNTPPSPAPAPAPSSDTSEYLFADKSTTEYIFNR